jgi:hypothetical protein
MAGAECFILIDAEGNKLEGNPGRVPAGCIGGVVKTPTGMFVAVPVTEESRVIDGNLGVYETFQLAVEALLSNHRRPWTREERRRAAGGW